MQGKFFRLAALLILSVLPLSAGQIVEDFTKTDIDGVTTSLYDELAQGKAVMLDFFSIQCHICKEKTQYINAIQKDYGARLSVWKISVNGHDREPPEKIHRFNGWYNSQVRAFSNGVDEFAYFRGLLNYGWGTPTYFLILPDRTLAWGQRGFSDAGLRSQLNAAGLAPTDVALQELRLTDFALAPNPAADRSMLRFSLLESSSVRVNLYDAMGRQLKQLFNGYAVAGTEYAVGVATSALPEGIYFLELLTDKARTTRRVMVLR